ncbi:hypothetical protein CR513_44140, partial [Mucuna pruriens]
MNIFDPFFMAKGQVKFLHVVVDYFTKWIEAKSLVAITIQKNNFNSDNNLYAIKIDLDLVEERKTGGEARKKKEDGKFAANWKGPFRRHLSIRELRQHAHFKDVECHAPQVLL